MRIFPFGPAALAILCLALLSGGWLAAHPPARTDATLTFWTFAKPHYLAYQKALPAFEKANPGVKVDMQLVANSSLASRLQAAFQADLDVPDLVEIEISSAGTFFRGPVEHVGFVDLAPRLAASGLRERMVPARFAPYTSRGRVFGLPHDVHPVMLAYRRDLLEAEGIDANAIETWDDFIAAGRRFTQLNRRYMIELPDSEPSRLEIFLFQRGGGYFDPSGRCIFDNETAVETMRWYVPLVAGPSRIASNLGGGQILTQAVEDGYFACLVAPDWRTKSIEQDIPRVAGRMALMPLPAVRKGGRRTSTWGGTMIGITRRCRQPDLAWKLALHLYLDKPELAARFRETNILPAMVEAWDHPSYREPRPYWSGQRLGALYAALAPQVPAQYTSPFIGTAKAKLGEALVACVQEYRRRPVDDAAFETFCRRTLKRCADHVRRQIARNPY